MLNSFFDVERAVTDVAVLSIILGKKWQGVGVKKDKENLRKGLTNQ